MQMSYATRLRLWWRRLELRQTSNTYQQRQADGIWCQYDWTRRQWFLIVQGPKPILRRITSIRPYQTVVVDRLTASPWHRTSKRILLSEVSFQDGLLLDIQTRWGNRWKYHLEQVRVQKRGYAVVAWRVVWWDGLGQVEIAPLTMSCMVKRYRLTNRISAS